ncbi:progesterone receptor [Spea bombifrons]|uniref:progesterone receptor n=1 Tax=Spea bombifrons TaxID=233779 RepID=UPI002349606E|nr:progesterone receptor [Spea bombifrons]
MENKKGTSSSSPQPCPGAETSRYPSSPGNQMDLFEHVAESSAISLDSLLYQRSEDEYSYQKGEGPGNSDNNEFQSVLDSILESSSGHLLPWSDFMGSEITSIFGSSPKVRTPSGQGEVGATQDAAPPKGTTKTSVETDPYEASSTNCPSLTQELKTINMSVLPLNPVYSATQSRQILELEGDNQKSLSPNTSQHLAGSTSPQSNTKQGSYFHHEIQPESKVKKEGDGVPPLKSPSGNAMCQDYGLPPKQANTSDSEQPLDFILYKSTSDAVYDSYRSAPGSAAQSPTHVLPSTSIAPQNPYQTFCLNDHQHLDYQTTILKENCLSQMHLPYLQFIRADSDPEHGSPYSFESLPQKICLICGDEASGCHYGVVTCGSCKVFFKRAVEGQHNYLCAGRNDCIIDKIRRKNCPSCRLRKCCQAGMVLGGRKFKKFSKMKTGRETDAVVLQQPMVIPVECQQILARRISAQEIQYVPELLQILQSIEPEVVYAGYDNTQPETPSTLLSRLNQLCERQLLCVVKWSKSLPGFRTLHIDDQITLLQYSWMSLMVFAMGWRSYKHVSGQMLYFAPDLILNEQRMKDSSFYTLCLSMWQLPQEFVKLQVTHEEFLCMKALLLLNTIPLEGLKSQSHFDEMRSNYIRELAKAIGLRHKGVVASSQRFYHLTKVMDSMHELVKQLHLYCLNTFLQSRALSVEFPEMMSEVISAQLPKILAGMVKPLVFHKK